MPKPLISCNNLKKSFFVGDSNIEALKGVDLEIFPGEFVVVFGPSGCGKTTLLSLLAGLDKPTEGEVFFAGNDVYKLRPDGLAMYRRTKISMVFQQFNLIPTLSAIDNVAMPLILNGVERREAETRALEILDNFDMKDRYLHKPSEMSGGQQQRVAIARALSANPSLLLVDEPTGNLDVPTGNEIMSLLKSVNKKWGRTVVLVTHNPDFLKYGDKVLYMEDGKVIKKVENKDAGKNLSESESDLKFYRQKKNGSMKIWEVFRLSKIHFFSRKLRTFLTTLGVSLGVGSIVTLVSLGIGMQRTTSNQLASIDALVTIAVTVGKNSINGLNESAITKLKEVKNVSLSSPSVTMPAKISYANSTTQTLVAGIMPQALSFEGVVPVAGSSYGDDKGVIVSRAVVKNFDVDDPKTMIGQKISLNVIVIPEESTDLLKFKNIQIDDTIVGVSSDETISAVYLSLDRLVKATAVTDYTSIKLKVADRKYVEGARDQVEKMGYTTTSVVDLIKKVDKVFLITQIVLGVIGGVALLVALVGIVNIMTISLLERTHEVGIIKAIGASNKDVRRIFEYEVLMFGFLGAFFGVGGSWLFGSLVNVTIIYLMRMSDIGGSIEIFVTPLAFAIEMIVITMLVSLLAGWYPAKMASKLSPMEALRYE